MKQLVALSIMALYCSQASAEVYVCLEGDHKVFRDRPCAEERETLNVYKALPLRVIRPPSLYSGAAGVRSAPAASAPARPVTAPPETVVVDGARQAATENCDAYVTAPTGTWTHSIEEKNRQRCLDRQAGIATGPRTVIVPQAVVPKEIYCRPSGVGGMNCSRF